MPKFMISWDDETVLIEAPRSAETMELVKRVLEIGMNPVGARKVKPNREKIRKRLQEKQLLNHIYTILNSPTWKGIDLDLSHEDGIVAHFYGRFPNVEVNDHRLRRHIRKIIKGG